MWLADHFPTLSAVAASATAAYFKINHIIDAAENIPYKNIWQVLRAYFTRQPIRKPQQTPDAGKEEVKMSFLDDLEAFGKKLETILGVACALEQKVGPLVAIIAPQTAPEVAMANAVASGVGAAIQAHEAAGGTPQSAASALASIAQTVAASGLVDANTAAKINQIAPVSAPVAQEVIDMVTSGA